MVILQESDKKMAVLPDSGKKMLSCVILDGILQGSGRFFQNLAKLPFEIDWG